MDINDFRSLATVTCFIALMGVFWWAYSPKRKKDFDEAAQLPFGNDADEDLSAKKNVTDEEHKR